MSDVYKEWFNIPEDQRPPTYYQLLGVRDFESDTDAIDRASRERIRFLRDRQLDQRYEDEVQQLLNEVSRARVTLRDPQKRAAYDRELRELTGATPKAFGVETEPIAEDIAYEEALRDTVVRYEPSVETGSGTEDKKSLDINHEYGHQVDLLDSFRSEVEAILRSGGGLNVQTLRQIHREAERQGIPWTDVAAILEGLEMAWPHARSREQVPCATQTKDAAVQREHQTAQRLPAPPDEEVRVPSLVHRLTRRVKMLPKTAIVLGLPVIGASLFLLMVFRPAHSNETTNSIGVELVLIPAGEFTMGSPEDEKPRDDDEGPQHRVRISKAFYIGKYEVTQQQYEAVMGRNPSRFKGTNNPVEMVSWNDAVKFCRRLSEKEGREYGLPTEAEWEYACRAGSATCFCYGDDPGYEQLGDYAWYMKNGGHKTHPVGQKEPNAWGLYDMHGNVWEWCADWYDADYYKNSPLGDANGPSRGSYRVLRGGSWRSDPKLLRSALRYRFSPTSSHILIGFRILLRPRGLR